MLGFSRICSSEPSLRVYLVFGPQIGMSLIYGMVISDISSCSMLVTSSWNIGTELVYPISRVTK